MSARDTEQATAGKASETMLEATAMQYRGVPPLVQPAYIEGQDAVVLLREQVAQVHLDVETAGGSI
jgi:hypothetical protein